MATQDVACALQKAFGAKRPRSYGGKWGAFTGDYAEMEFDGLQEEAVCEGVDLMVWDRFCPRQMLQELMRTFAPCVDCSGKSIPLRQ